MLKTEEILDAARAIRPFLVKLLGETKAKDVDPQLAALLGKANQGEKVASQILTLLAQNSATREWMKRMLPPKTQTRSYLGVPGKGRPVKGQRFDCPHGDYSWFRRSTAMPVPDCPTHGVPLVAKP